MSWGWREGGLSGQDVARSNDDGVCFLSILYATKDRLTLAILFCNVATRAALVRCVSALDQDDSVP